MIHLLALVLLASPADSSGWELAAKADRLSIYARKQAGTEVREMKAIGVIDAPPHEVLKAISDYENYPKTMPYVIEARVLERIREGAEVVLYSRLSMPLVSQRDYIIQIVDDSQWRDGAGFLKVSWTVAQDKQSLVPQREGVVRISINNGGWILEPKDEGKKTLTTYFISSSPGGAIPNFIANQANTIAVPKVFEAVRNVVTKSRSK